ncbi:MAG: hypothetical protein B193_3885 [Solidesulfovibrio magneticus str. Maddingley MBC34]|uniref:Uncharacterized protein n=1 Tax=Solidesulfovibrio magneticus str. Maddingley MBC34 TaxID=1206767 RepID=K6GKD2_9BACT|nr:MAG: hypothetical protein B193_3885 [Solidesulfovibrio magneticus str. Maddingley MBC34]
MWQSFVIVAVAFVALSVGLWLVIRKTVSRRHDVIAPGKFDFDAFKSREITRRGVHDSTRLGKKR